MQDTALIIVDPQNDFLWQGGTLYVAPGTLDGGDLTPQMQYIYRMMSRPFGAVVVTKDWHPEQHCSFVPEGGPWPVHCVAEQWGANIVDYFPMERVDLILHKGTRKNVDSYSAFYEADGKDTGLTNWLVGRGITRTSICGVASEVCVNATATHSLENFETTILAAGCWGLAEDTTKETFDGLKVLGARIIG